MRSSLKLAVIAALIMMVMVGCKQDAHRTDLKATPQPPSGTEAVLEQLDTFLAEGGQPDRGSVIEGYHALNDLFDQMKDQEDEGYLFSPEELHEIAQLGVGLPVEQAWDVIHQEMLRRHPGKILETPRWTFNSAGTAFCQIAIVYASTKEYVAYFGTPIGAEGFSGRYSADVWDLMVDGEMWTYVPGQFEPTVYLAGDLAYLPRDGGKGVQYVDHAWMIDYGRGDIITMFPFGVIAPAMFTTLDYTSAWEQFVDFGKAVIRNFLNP